MVDIVIASAVALATFGFGLAFGAYANYLIETRPLLQAYDELVDRMYRMKRQGFVPNYEVDNTPEFDPSQDIVEY